MVAFIQKAHGCIFFYDAIEVQEAQLAISNSRSVLQEQQCTTKARWYRFLKQRARRGKLTLYLELKNSLIVQVDEGRNYYPTSLSLHPSQSFPENHKKVLPGTSLFHPEASMNKPNQVKPTLLSLLFWDGLSGVSCFHCWQVIPLARIFGGGCLPTTLVAVTTLYFSSRNFRQSLVLTLL